MKCFKCNYVSHDYLDVCRKCGVDLVAFKQDMGLLVLQPGVLDLGRVLGEAGADDLFASVEEEVTRHARDDDDFDISLDDYADHPETWRAPVRTPRAGARETTENMAGLDHLTLELDASDLPAELAASLHAAPALPNAPPHAPTPAGPPPAVPGGSLPSGDVTLDIEPESRLIELPSGAFAELTSTLPPRVPETAATPVQGSEMAESGDDVARAAEVSGAMASLPSQDVVLAEDTAVAPQEQVPESVDQAIPTLDDAALMFTDEHVPPQQPSSELTATVGDATPDDAVISSDMFVLEDSAESTLSGNLIIDLSAPDTGPEQGLTTSDALALGALDDTVLPGHLTLELDASEIMANWSSGTLDDVRLDDPSGAVQSEMSPPQNQAGDEENLSLDLDEFEFDDDAHA